MNQSFCGVPTPGLVYVGPATREEFDLIDLPETVQPWIFDITETLLRNDGTEWQRRCRSKCLGELGKDSICVIFQWFEARPEGQPNAINRDAEIPAEISVGTHAVLATGGGA
ncbi:hypothetical protein WCE55_02315 [Luteimonas sp. MJ293]|uniref:hypothetical protein n=1 Tax=Luteimonas sp. MJ146 TaxID=3129240 RepID=UPI0031BAD584